MGCCVPFLLIRTCTLSYINGYVSTYVRTTYVYFLRVLRVNLSFEGELQLVVQGPSRPQSSSLGQVGEDLGGRLRVESPRVKLVNMSALGPICLHDVCAVHIFYILIVVNVGFLTCLSA